MSGRPTVITTKVVSLLVASFQNGLTVREACWQSGISHEAYYSRLRSDEQFADIMTKAQSDITMAAKKLLAKQIRKGSVSAAKWWLGHDKNQAEMHQITSEADTQTMTDEEFNAALDIMVKLRQIRSGYKKSGE